MARSSLAAIFSKQMKKGIYILKHINIGRMTAAIYRTGVSVINHRLRELDIDGGQLDILYGIASKEGISQVELSKFMYIGKPAATKAVKNFMARGYVYRETDPLDKRVNRLYLTEKGRSVSQKMEATFQEIIYLHKKNLTEEEAILTVELLEKVLAGLFEEKERENT